jgi:hypothetical protein
MSATTELMIAAPKLERFVLPEKMACCKCATRVFWYETLVSALKGGQGCCFNVSWCAGGKEPVEQLSPLQMMTTGRSEMHIACAGVMREHLHARCRRCGHEVLMETSRGER